MRRSSAARSATSSFLRSRICALLAATFAGQKLHGHIILMSPCDASAILSWEWAWARHGIVSRGARYPSMDVVPAPATGM